MKIAIITHLCPYGRKETYIGQELLELNKIADISILTRQKAPFFNSSFSKLRKNTFCTPVMNLNILISFFGYALQRPHRLYQIIKLIFQSRSFPVLLKNLSIVPKSIYLAKWCNRNNITHIHAHWASINTTMALIISQINNIPFSFTAHRFDIDEDNLLELKLSLCQFARVLSKDSQRKLKNYSVSSCKIVIIPISVKVEKFQKLLRPIKKIKILMLADYIEIKNHKFAVEMLARLEQKNIDYSCDMFGEGPLMNKISSLVSKKRLTGRIKIGHRIQHSEILSKMHRREYNLLVLTSTVENTPVCILEASAHSMLAICSPAGATHEIVSKASIVDKLDINLYCTKIIEQSKLSKYNRTLLLNYKIVERNHSLKKNMNRLYGMMK